MLSAIKNWTVDKTVAQTSYHAHPSDEYPVLDEFVAPAAPSVVGISLTFGMEALQASIGRTSTLNGVSTEVMYALGLSAMIQMNALVKDTKQFEVDPEIQKVVDATKSNFAGQIAAGIVDLAMSAMNYQWRDGAHILAEPLDPHADFIYGGGPAEGLGVVLAESHGSFKDKVNWKYIRARGKSKYTRQVEPYLTNTCIHGQVIHGYSIAFGSHPGKPGAFLHISESTGAAKNDPKKTQPRDPGPARPVQTRIALTTHRSNFGLMGAKPIVEWIDYIAHRGPAPVPEAIEFLTFRYDRRNFVIFTSPAPEHPDFHPFALMADDPRCWINFIDPSYRDFVARGGCGWFVMEEGCALSILKALTSMIADPDQEVPETIELAVTAQVGFGLGVREGEGERDYRYALYPDGLALLGGPRPKTLVAISRWDPKLGITELFRGEIS